jgi:integrase
MNDDTTNAVVAFKRVLNDAELPLHFTPHRLRHTFASRLLQQGESPAYVQRQLGHLSPPAHPRPDLLPVTLSLWRHTENKRSAWAWMATIGRE